MSLNTKPTLLRRSALSTAVITSVTPRPDFGVKSPLIKPKFNSTGMNIYDFLYGFAIAYGIMVKDCEIAGKRPVARELFLVTWCEKMLKEKKLADQAFTTASKIIKAVGSQTQLSNGKWVNASMFIYDAWFDLLIGKRWRTKNSVDIPESYIKQLDQASTAAANIAYG